MLPALPDWSATKNTLHLASQVISALRKTAQPPLPNHLHHSLTPTPNGVTTGPLPQIGMFSLDFTTGTIHHLQNGQSIDSYMAQGQSQASLFEAIAEHLHDMDYDIALPTPDFSTDTLTFDPSHGATFATVLRTMYTTLAWTKSHFYGFQTPVVQWSHGFDLSTIWFPDGEDEDSDPHMNFGFSPGTADHPEPYLYVYAYPTQTALRDALPEGFNWETSWGTHGASLALLRPCWQCSDPVVEAGHKLMTLYHVGESCTTRRDNSIAFP
jgi:hypothetical protein